MTGIRHRRYALAFALLLFAPLALHAAPGTAPLAKASPANLETEAPGLCATPSSATVATIGALWMVPGPGALSTCVANCWDGTTRTCTGSTCSAYDSACPEEEGRCFGSDPLSHKKCPPCSTPCPSPSCEDLDGTYCKYSGTCYAGPSCIAHTCNCYNNTFICP